MRQIIIIFSLLLSGPLHAQDVEAPVERVTHLTLDLNGDGLAELFELSDVGDGTADLTIIGEGPRPIKAAGLATTGAGAELPTLSVLGDGRLAVTSFHDARGAIRWTRSLWIDFPDGSYRVTGYSYVWWSETDPMHFGYCELDFRAGRGSLQSAANAPYYVDIDIPSLPVTRWADTQKLLPVDCS